MKPKEEKTDIGVIIGRFQTHKLHDAHKDLIDTVIKKHDRVIIFLGVNSIPFTKNNPLDFGTRQKMINEIYPNIIILPIKDCKFDTDWCKSLDQKIREVYPLGTVTLYGSRDSFISHYKGLFNTVELEQEVFVSATEIREELKNKIMGSSDFRAGCIYTTQNQYDISYSAISVIIYNEDRTKFLLGKKSFDKDKYRMIGGFVDITDNSLEDTVKREINEELDIEVDNIKYIKSVRMPDWRYRSEKDKVMSMIFTCKYVFGSIKPKDDNVEAKWFNVKDVENNPSFITEHSDLIKNIVLNKNKE